MSFLFTRAAALLFFCSFAFAQQAEDSLRVEVKLRKGVMFPEKPGVMASRELVADDYVYALKRHATTRITAPIFGIFSEYVVGLKDYGELIKQEDAKLRAGLESAAKEFTRV